MPPIDGQLAIPAGPQGGGGTIPLSTLIDYIVQRTYHELMVLSELLPRKTDMERKIEIVQFASRTRQLFIRLLALVKWTTNASKVDKCADICNFLERQSLFFVDTADMLAKMARETLVNARLPNFSIPCAIDVLTLGTYPRLPTCIRDKIVPQDPITYSEKRQTLHRLNQVIQYRLVSTDLPPQMRKLRIENGRVKFHVDHEFEVTLTLMGDNPSIPWRLLDIEILVEDHETGDGKSLVHSLQINYMHQLVQSRLLDNDKPLHDLYRVLHSFCQSLQLEVLFSQIQRLLRDRLGDSVRVEDYAVGKNLIVSYWRDQIKKDKTQDYTVYKLSVHVSDQDGAKPLQITHTPPMLPLESRKVGLAIRSDHLSIERLLMQTIEVRTHLKLKELEREIQRFIEGKCVTYDLPVALHIPVLFPCMKSEHLRITVDAQKGMWLVSLPSQDLPVVQEIEDCLNGEKKGFGNLLIKLRLQLALFRCERSITSISTSCSRQLPIINIHGHPLESVQHKLFIKIPKQMNHFLIVEVSEKPPKSVEYKYYLLETISCTGEGVEDDIGEDIGVKSFFKAGRLLPLDSFSVTHGPSTKLFESEEESEMDELRKKRKLLLGEPSETESKMYKVSPYFVPELAYILANCEEKLPFVTLGRELSKNGVSSTGVQVDGDGSCFSLGILNLPSPEGCSEEDCEHVRKALLSCTIRVLGKSAKVWQAEFVFQRSPLHTKHKRENGRSQRVVYSFDMSTESIHKIVSDLLEEWAAMTHLYGTVKDFADIHRDSRCGMQNRVDILSFNYRRLSLAYGPTRSSIANIQWKVDTDKFQIRLGTVGKSSTSNPHVQMHSQLLDYLNHTKSIADLAQILDETWAPMTSINKLSTAVMQGGGTVTLQQMLNFTVIPQSVTHVRIVFRNVNCLDVHFRGGNIVSVRDGAYSLFDTIKAMEGFTTTPALKAFLNIFVDDAVTFGHTRRRSTTEDDNPPSPVDNLDIFTLSQSSGSSPTSRRQDGGLRFHSPMTPPSNPNTPASPSTSRISAGVAPSPSTAFIGTPSPGNLLVGESPGNPTLHVPSPGSFVPAPSPQSLGIHMPSPAASFISPQGMVEGGSPFTGSNLAMPSPGTRNWPGSPSMQGPSPASRHPNAASPGYPGLHSPQTVGQMKEAEHKAAVMNHPARILPNRSWAASIPTLLSHNGFDQLLTPDQPSTQHLSPAVGAPHTSPLERFLGCVHLRKHIPRVLQKDDGLINLQSNEQGVILFAVEKLGGLQFRISVNPQTLQSLHLKVIDTMDQWNPDDLQILEQFFDYKVAAAPYRVNTVTAFTRLINFRQRILKDFIQIMRLELMPDRSMKWSIQWCLTFPLVNSYLASYSGSPAVVSKNQIVIAFQLTRIGLQLPKGTEPQSIFTPLKYDPANNSIQLLLFDSTKPNATHKQTPAQAEVAVRLKRFTEFHQNPNECSIFPAVRELMANLVLPV
ncbi:hypothetical protein ScPMuIL_013444 [Solemya velum]